MGKEGYGVDALRVTRGDGISGFSSRSDQARARELSKYGLTMKWYDDKSQEQGEGICADCSKPEVSRLGNGKRRPLGLGFNSDGTPDRLICTNCASKQRKARMEEKNAPKSYESFEQFWEVNRQQLQKEDALAFATFRERDAEVREIYEIIGIYLARHDGRDCYQLQDTLDEIEQELIQNGTTDLDQLSAPFYKVEHRHLFDEIQRVAEVPDDPKLAPPKHARNAAVFAKYGWLQALPVSAGDHVVREFLRKYGRWPYPDWGKAPTSTEIVKCATYACKNELSYNINTGPIPPAQWHCQKCRAEQRARHEKRVGRTLAEVAPDCPYFANGRVTTLDTSNVSWFAKLPGEP